MTARRDNDPKAQEPVAEQGPVVTEARAPASGKQVAVAGAIGTLVIAIGMLAQMGFLPSTQDKMDLEKRLLRIEQKQQEIADTSGRAQAEILKEVQEINSKLDSKLSVSAFELWRLKLQLSNPQLALTVPQP